MCAGAHLANRELFTFFVRLIVAFRVLPPNNIIAAAEIDPYKFNLCTTALVAEPKPFKCRFEPRDADQLRSWLDENRSRVDLDFI